MRPGPAGRNPERSRLWAARMTSAFRRAPRVPFRTDEKEPKVRLRTLRLGRPARAAPGARYARRPISGLRAAFGGWPPKRGLRTAVAGAPPRDPGLSPLRGPGPMGRNSKRYPPGSTLPVPAGYRRSPRVHQLKAQFRLRALPTDEAGWLAGDARRKTTPVPGVRALCARARRSRAVFRLPVGHASEIKAAVPPPSALPIRFRRLAGRGIAPAARRRAGCCRLVR